MNRKLHNLKTHREPFAAVWDGIKPYELRRDDRGFQVGDLLRLREWDEKIADAPRQAGIESDPEAEAYTGREILAVVTYKTSGGEYGLPADLCVLAIDPVEWSSPDEGRAS